MPTKDCLQILPAQSKNFCIYYIVCFESVAILDQIYIMAGMRSGNVRWPLEAWRLAFGLG